MISTRHITDRKLRRARLLAAVIGAPATRDGLDLLLALHNEQGDWHHRSTLVGEIEKLVGKLGVFIQRDGASLTLIDQ